MNQSYGSLYYLYQPTMSGLHAMQLMDFVATARLAQIKELWCVLFIRWVGHWQEFLSNCGAGNQWVYCGTSCISSIPKDRLTHNIHVWYIYQNHILYMEPLGIRESSKCHDGLWLPWRIGHNYVTILRHERRIQGWKIWTYRDVVWFLMVFEGTRT